MFKIGDFVVKRSCGILKVADIVELAFVPGQPKKSYYVLVSADKNMTVNVPLDNADKLIRPIMQKVDAKRAQEEIVNSRFDWVSDEKLRKKMVEGMLTGSIEDAQKILGTYYTRESENKKLALFERTAVEVCEEKVFGEIAFVLGKTLSEVKDRVRGEFGLQLAE